MAFTPSTSSGPSVALPGAWSALALLLVINLFNYIDRQVLSAVLPKLKRDTTLFDPTDEWRLTKLGALATAFMVAYMILSPIFAWAGGFVRRWWLIGGGIVLWSLASGSTGLATTYAVLFLMRCLVGVGEAAYGPIAPALLSELFPAAVRGKVMAWFYVAIPVGSALGFVIGGVIADLYDWRHAFWVTYSGVALGFLAFFFRDPLRATTAAAVPRTPYLSVLKEVVRIRSFVLLCLGMTATTFVLGGVAVWVPEYIFQREARFAVDERFFDKLATDDRYLSLDRGSRLVPGATSEKLRPLVGRGAMDYAELDDALKTHLTVEERQNYTEFLHDAATAEESITLGEIGLSFGVITVVSGLVATLLGGWLGDRLRARGVRGAYFQVCGWSTLLAWPPLIGFAFAPFPWAWVCLFVAVFFLFFNTGPANTILANVVRTPVRATGFAINILVIHALGDAISPMLIGFVSDLADLQTAFLLASLFVLVGGGLWLLGTRYLDDDTRRAGEADAAPPTTP